MVRHQAPAKGGVGNPTGWRARQCVGLPISSASVLWFAGAEFLLSFCFRFANSERVVKPEPAQDRGGCRAEPQVTVSKHQQSCAGAGDSAADSSASLGRQVADLNAKVERLTK